jgi:hypothetical protein
MMEDVLQDEFPQATRAECRRFLKACSGKKTAAVKLLQEYLEWRSIHRLDDPSQRQQLPTSSSNSTTPKNKDAADWQYAVTKAFSATTTTTTTTKSLPSESLTKLQQEHQTSRDFGKGDSKPPKTTSTMNESDHTAIQDWEIVGSLEGNEDNEEIKLQLPHFPQWVFIHPSPEAHDEHDNKVQNPMDASIPSDDDPSEPQHRTKFLVDQNDKTILHMLPARLDRSVVSAATCALAVAFYLDCKLDRHSEETMTIFLDTRAGIGWPNPSAVNMIPFIHKVSKQLETLYPERLEYLIVAPIPPIASYIWTAVKRFLWKRTRDRVLLAPGPAGRDSPLPKDNQYILAHIKDHVLEYLDQVRLNQFERSSTSTEQR